MRPKLLRCHVDFDRDMKPPLLILDLDEILIFGTETPLARLPDLMVGAFGIYLRPHVDVFLMRVSALYRLAVWTVAALSYAAHIDVVGPGLEANQGFLAGMSSGATGTALSKRV